MEDSLAIKGLAAGARETNGSFGTASRVQGVKRLEESLLHHQAQASLIPSIPISGSLAFIRHQAEGWPGPSQGRDQRRDWLKIVNPTTP
jgi:hypothetical protein